MYKTEFIIHFFLCLDFVNTNVVQIQDSKKVNVTCHILKLGFGRNSIEVGPDKQK